MSIVMGDAISICNPLSTDEQIHDGIIMLLKEIAIISSLLLFFSYIQFAYMQSNAERLAFTWREKYLDSLMRQETEFFEKQQVEALPSQISENFAAISLGLGEKLGQLIFSLSAFFGGLAIGLWKGPIYTCMCLAYLPFFIIIIGIFGSRVKKVQAEKLSSLEKLGGHTEETLSALKLVISFA